MLGCRVGEWDGKELGCTVGETEGPSLGDKVGEREGAGVGHTPQRIGHLEATPSNASAQKCRSDVEHSSGSGESRQCVGEAVGAAAANTKHGSSTVTTPNIHGGALLGPAVMRRSGLTRPHGKVEKQIL